MGITLSSQPKTSFDNTKLKDGKKVSLRDAIIIRILPNGFSPSSLTIYSGQFICWEWEAENSDIEYNVKQVALCEGIPVLVPNGLRSGEECSFGSYQVNISTPGTYHFISDGHAAVRVGTIKVVESPPEVIKVSDHKFLPSFVEISEGESVTWKWEAVKGGLNRLEFCPRHCGVISSKVNFTPDENTSGSYTEYFQNPGMYYFTGDSKEVMCAIKVVQRTREFSILFEESGAEPSFVNSHVGDRLWVKNTLTKANDGIMMIKAEDGGILVSSRGSTSKKDRRPNLISYCFAFPGIYRVSCTLGFTSLHSIVLVKPKPSDYVININKQGFLTGLGSMKQGDRIWWVWSEEETEKHGFLIEEAERMALVGKNTKKDAPCQCCQETELLPFISNTGLLSLVADTPGLVNYRVKEVGDWTLPNESLCSIIVQSIPKDHIVQVNDHIFKPQIVNIHPGDSVTWLWRDTMKSHNIQQVSHERVDMGDGFHSNMLSRSPEAFSHMFIDLGVFYFTSSNLCGAYGAVVVTAGNQVHKVEVTHHGVDPDPVGVRVGDMVCWRWNSDQLYSINCIKSPDEIDGIVKNQEIPPLRRCLARTFPKAVLQHIVATAYLPDDDDDDESTLQPSDSFINTIYVDHAPYSCRMRVSRDGFQPRTVVLAKHDSILWYWDDPDDKHNIVLVENPKGRARPIAVHGPAFFESGSVTRCSSFFHTFDTPGSYWVTSHGTDGQTSRIDVLNEVKRLLAPVIIGGNDGGNVELGYRVLLSCDDHNVQIIYTTDGSQPAEQNPATKVYNDQEGIRLSKPGLYLIRALSTKDGWINSQTFTSRRFWVFCEVEQEVNDENQDQSELRQEISNWQWFNCTPSISFVFVYDNVIQIDIGLPKIADLSIIAGFQLYINGIPYGSLLRASCPGVLVSGLAGHRVYHMVIAVFSNLEEFRPQLSNQIVVSCPALSSIGGPLVSLETCGRVDAIVIVWAANRSCQYTVLINGQPMGGQFFPEPDINYCRVLFEMENPCEEQTFMICVEMKHEEDDMPFYSNEIQLSLPLPEDLVAVNNRQPTTYDQELHNGLVTSEQQLQDGFNGTFTDSNVAAGQDDLKLTDDHKARCGTSNSKEYNSNHNQQTADIQPSTTYGANDNQDVERATVITNINANNLEETTTNQTGPDSVLNTNDLQETSHNKTQEAQELQNDGLGVYIEHTELLIISELPLDDKHPASNTEATPSDSGYSYKNNLDTIHEDKPLDIVHTPLEDKIGKENTMEIEKERKEDKDLKDKNGEPGGEPGGELDNRINDKGDIETDDGNDTGEVNNEITNAEDNIENINGKKDGEVSNDITDGGEDGIDKKDGEKVGANNNIECIQSNDGIKDQDNSIGKMSNEEHQTQEDNDGKHDIDKDNVGGGQDQADNTVDEEGGVNKTNDRDGLENDNKNNEISVERTIDEEVEINKNKEVSQQVDDQHQHKSIEDPEYQQNNENNRIEDKRDDTHLEIDSQTQNELRTNYSDQEHEVIVECESPVPFETFDNWQGSSTFSKFLNQLEETLTMNKTPTLLETTVDVVLAEEYYSHPTVKDVGYYSACTLKLQDEETSRLNEKEMNGQDEKKLKDENETNENLDGNERDEDRHDEPKLENENEETNGKLDGNERDEDTDDEMKQNENEATSSKLDERETNENGHDEKVENENQESNGELNGKERDESEPDHQEVQNENKDKFNEKEMTEDDQVKKEENLNKELTDNFDDRKEYKKSERGQNEIKENEEILSKVNEKERDTTTDNDREPADTEEQTTSDSDLLNKDNQHIDTEDKTEEIIRTNLNENEDKKNKHDKRENDNANTLTKLNENERNETEQDERETEQQDEATITQQLNNIIEHNEDNKETEELQDSNTHVIFDCQLTSDLKLAVKGATSNGVVLKWEDNTNTKSPEYTVMVLGERFNSDVDSQERYELDNTPTLELWPSDKTSHEQHQWTTNRTIIEIHGLKAKQRYRIAVLVRSCDHTNTYFRSDIIVMTMPGRPKAPVIRVLTLKDREFIICWRTPSSYGEAKIIGYKLLINGSQHGDLLPSDIVQHTVNKIQHGTFQHVTLIAVTGHVFGDSTSSNVVTIACPHPPPPPEIIEYPSTTSNAICVSWQQVSMTTDVNQLRLLSSYDVFVDDVLHGCCPASDVTDIFQDSFTYTIPDCIAERTYSIYVRCHVDPQSIESSPPAHMCGCYGDKSNVLQVRCAKEPQAPGLVVDYIDETRVNLSWEKPTQGTPHDIQGYVLRVDGRIHGSILDPEATSAILTNLSLGNDAVVSLTALHSQERVDQLHANLNRPSEGQDSGVESSSSMGLDRRLASGNLGPSLRLTLHLWGLVQKICDVRVINVSCCAVDVRWNVLERDDTCEEGQRPLNVKPESFKVTLFKSEELEEMQVMSFDTKNTDMKVTDLLPSSRYAVTVEAFADHANYTSGVSKWNVSKSEKQWFDTKPPPYPPQNIKVEYSSLSSICLTWDSLDTDNDLKFLHLDVYKIDCRDDDLKLALSFVINPNMTSYTIHSLDSKTHYLFKFSTSYSEGEGNEKQHSCSTSSSIKAWTSGVGRPRDLHVTKSTPFSLHVAWQPAVTFGDLYVLHYLVHYMEKKSRPPHGSGSSAGNTISVPQGSLLGPRCEIKCLEPGVTYTIIVEAVVKENRESKDIEEQTNEVDETGSSVGSSESDLVSLVAQDCLSKSITVSTIAPPGKPELLVTGLSATQIHISWNKPTALQLEPEDILQAKDQELCGRVRQISGYTLEANGRIVTRLSPNQHSFILKRCKPGMKYTCYLVVMTTLGDTGGKERRNESKKKKVSTIKNTELTDSEDEQTNSFQEARSDPLEVTIPRQDPPLVLKLYYNPISSHVSSSSSAGSEESDEGCVVLEWKSSTPLKGVVSYRVHWRSTLEGEDEKEEELLSSSTSYEVYPVKQRSVYSVWLKMTRKEGCTISYGPLHCQVPGRPDSPWIWCKSISSYRVLVEWNEPKTYGIDTIRAYQINLNGRQLGKLLSPQTRKAAVHCQPNSVYRITLMALTTDISLGDSESSNLLTVCTPGVTKKELDPKQNIRLKPLWAENNSLTVEWSDDNDLLTVDHYVIKWSSVRQPQSLEDIIPVEETSYRIEDCPSGTRHFIAVAAVDDRGNLVSKSTQLIMQTSAPLAAPELRLYSALPYSIIVDWDKPLSIGDATVDSYEIKVDGEIVDSLDSNDVSYEFPDCSPCEECVFRIKALSIKDECHSDWSQPLPVVCPGAWQPVISRAPSSHVNCIHVAWETPRLFGSATVDNYKVHYLASEEEKMSLESILDNQETITHDALQPLTHDDTLTNALSSLPYWVALEVTLLPVGCHTVFSQPIKTRVAAPPDPPWVSVVVVGLKERKTLERFVSRLAQLKDRICRKVQLLQNTVVVKGSKQKEIQITKNLATLRNLDIELGNCVQDIKRHTGTLIAELSWSRPRDDGDAIITGYQVSINDQKQGQPLDVNTLQVNLKLPASPSDHVITVESLTSHPIGHSAPSSQVTLQTKDFLPFVQFCYFGVHSKSRGCCYGDNLTYEIKNKQISTHRGSLGKPLPSPVCYAMDVVNSCSQPLIGSSDKPQIILFWTMWCHSSIKAVEMFMEFTRSQNHEMDFITCCVQSNQLVSGHHQSLHAQLKSHNWLTDNVKHLCGCHPVGQRSVLRRNEGSVSKGSVCHMYGLVGVPTIVLCNHDGYMVWQGRICAQDFTDYQQCLLHALSESLNQDCTIPNCDQCLLDNELNTTSQLIAGPMDDYYNYKSANHDPSLVVTGCLSRSRDIHSTDDHADELRQSKTNLQKYDSDLTQTVNSTTLENTEFLRRRLHNTRPQTSPSKEITASFRQSPKPPYSTARFSNGDRAKTANQTRSSVFQNRFSSSMTSSFPSLELTNERIGSRRQLPLNVKTKKVKISVDEFSPV